MDFSQTTPPKPHPRPKVDVKEMNFDPFLPASSNSSGSGLLDAMEIRHHDNHPVTKGDISTPPTITHTNTTRYVYMCINNSTL